MNILSVSDVSRGTSLATLKPTVALRIQVNLESLEEIKALHGTQALSQILGDSLLEALKQNENDQE